MNRYAIEVVFDDNHELVDVNVRGPGSIAGSYDVSEEHNPVFPQTNLRNLLQHVAADIELAEDTT